TSENDNAEEQRLRYFQEELAKATVDRVAKQSWYQLISKAPPDSLPETLDDRTLQENRAELTSLQRQLAELSSSFTPEYPKVAKIQAQIKTITAARIFETLGYSGVKEELKVAKIQAQIKAVTAASQAL